MKQIERQIGAIEAEIMERLQADPELAGRFSILTTIPGILPPSPSSSRCPSSEPSKQGRPPASPAFCSRWTGRAFIRGGRASVRHALYMPALVATRFNPDLKTKYQQLRKAGNPAKVAITAIMRKLVVLANALLCKNRLWTKKPT